MPPVPIDEPREYRRGRRVSYNEAVGTAPIPHGHAIVNSPPPNHSPQPKDQSVRYGGPYSSTPWDRPDRKSTRLNSSHLVISYAVFCLKKKKRCKHVSSTLTIRRKQGRPTLSELRPSDTMSMTVQIKHFSIRLGPCSHTSR